jgi:hypothetical protein
MSDDHGQIGGGRGTAQCGLRRLMLKLPARRQQLQALAVSSPVVRDLFEAYDEACIALEIFRHTASDDRLIVEYEIVCTELEADIVREL